MRNRVVVIMLLPVIILLWIIGWTLFWIGSQNRPQKTRNKKQREKIDVTTILYEDYCTQS